MNDQGSFEYVETDMGHGHKDHDSEPSGEKKEKKKWAPWVIGAGVAATLEGISLGLKGVANRNLEKNDLPTPMSREQQFETNMVDQLNAYAMRGIETQPGLPSIKGVDDPNFLLINSDSSAMINFSAKFRASFLFAMYKDETTGEMKINDYLIYGKKDTNGNWVFTGLAEQTGYPPDFLKSIWEEASKNPIYALDILKGAPKPLAPKVINFFQKANELYEKDLTKDESQDRGDGLFEWLKQNSSAEQGDQGLAILGRNEHMNWTEVAEIFNTPGFTDSARELADKAGVNAQDFMGAIADSAIDWQYQPNAIAQQLQAVETVASIYPEEKLALYAGFAADNVNFLTVCSLVGMTLVGRISRKLQTITFPKIDLSQSVDSLVDNLTDIGRQVMENLHKNSQEFRDWQEENRSKNNARKLARRLENGLSLSRISEISVGIMLADATNKDLRDLVLNEGPNWFRHAPENHPELPQIMRFFGCRKYQELQALANQPDRVVNRLYQVLVGSGKKADLRKTEQAKRLISLYKRASGFTEEENQ